MSPLFFFVLIYIHHHCLGQLECKTTTLGKEYEGNKNVTVSGRRCQAWGSQYPHKHRFGETESLVKTGNKCRNPDGEPRGPWCYTVDPNTRWEYCGIPLCNIDECASSPCVHGNCVDLANSYTCSCKPGYTGANCQTDINECQSSPCIHGNCTDHLDLYTCECFPGYTGYDCETDINECQSSPCIHGNCTDHLDLYTCECFPGYTGYDCETDINECQSSPCIHGNCTDHLDLYTCECFPGYTGYDCETDFNECASSPCVQGTCVDEIARYRCVCEVLFIGINCKFFNPLYATAMALALVAIITTVLWVFLKWRKKIARRQEKTAPAPFPFEDKRLGQSKSIFCPKH